MNIIKVTVQLTNMTDEVYLKTDLPCPFVEDALPSQPPLDLHFKATYDTGIEYVRRVFGIEPEIINSRHVSLSPRGFGKYNLYVHVTQKHIDAGIKKDCERCPISLAINECLTYPEYHANVGRDNCINLNYSDRHITQYALLLPREIVLFMNNFDTNKPTKPFVFVLPNVDERMIRGLV